MSSDELVPLCSLRQVVTYNAPSWLSTNEDVKGGRKKERRSQRNVNLDVSERIKCPKLTANIQFNIKAGDKERDHLTDVSLSGLY